MPVFDDLLRELHEMDGGELVPVSIATDADGYFDRLCRSEECQFEFKVHIEDWQDKVRSEEAFCPFCGHRAEATEWNTDEQRDYFQKAALAHLQHRIGHAMKRDAERFNRRQSTNSFIRMTMKVDSRPQQIELPPAAGEPMRLRITCAACNCRYAVVGAAFFCPACGHNAADLMFTQAIEGIRHALDALPNVREAIPDKDIADTTVRLIVENGLQNAVTAFQRYVEALFARFPGYPQARRNAFQNLKEGSELWNGVTGKPYAAYLNLAEQGALSRYFQQRHLLAHRQGLIDDDYVTKAGDSTYCLGQRLVVREAAVRDCLAIIEKLTVAMAADAPR
jgi:transposase